MEVVLSSSENDSNDICSHRKLSNLEFADDFRLLSENRSWLQVLPDHMNFSLDTAEVFYTLELQNAIAEMDWFEAESYFFQQEQLGKVGRFDYFDIFILPGARWSDGVFSRIRKAQLT